MSNSDDRSVRAWLSEHPRLVGVLFTLVLLLTQASTAAASNGSITYTGPQ